MEKNVAACLDAAIHVTLIVNELTEGKQIFRAFWVRSQSSNLKIEKTG
jgi:hypothetical protein